MNGYIALHPDEIIQDGDEFKSTSRPEWSCQRGFTDRPVSSILGLLDSGAQMRRKKKKVVKIKPFRAWV